VSAGPAPFTIREATIADARAIAEVHVEGWRWGYRDVLPMHVLDALSVEQREQIWTGALADRRGEDDCFVAEDGSGHVIGFVATGPADGDFAPPPDGAGEVFAIYLREVVQGTGVGRSLITRAMAAMRTHGFPTAVLWVFEANDLARRFYEGAGWEPDGASAASTGSRVENVRSCATRSTCGVSVPPEVRGGVRVLGRSLRRR
jgi:ribosomal protein S18 acetylase RimI-like enzyme